MLSPMEVEGDRVWAAKALSSEVPDFTLRVSDKETPQKVLVKGKKGSLPAQRE